MRTSTMKNIVVLNNLPSNIIDEAIVILKDNHKIKSLELSKSKGIGNTEENPEKDEYIVNEAEMLISTYINNLEKPKDNIKLVELRKKYEKLRKISIALLGTIVLLLIFKIVF